MLKGCEFKRLSVDLAVGDLESTQDRQLERLAEKRGHIYPLGHHDRTIRWTLTIRKSMLSMPGFPARMKVAKLFLIASLLVSGVSGIL